MNQAFEAPAKGEPMAINPKTSAADPADVSDSVIFLLLRLF